MMATKIRMPVFYTADLASKLDELREQSII